MVLLKRCVAAYKLHYYSIQYTEDFRRLSLFKNIYLCKSFGSVELHGPGQQGDGGSLLRHYSRSTFLLFIHILVFFSLYSQIHHLMSSFSTFICNNNNILYNTFATQ